MVTVYPMPEPSLERIPKTLDGHIWKAYAFTPYGMKIMGLGKTKRRAQADYEKNWNVYA